MRVCVVLLAMIPFLIVGCGGGGSSSVTPVSVSITPAAATLALNGSQQFSANVTNTTNQAVNWSVQEGAAGGTVSTTGLYHAPSNIAGTFHVVATSKADFSKSASGVVTVHLSISASPTSASLTLGQYQTFTATVVGSVDTAVTWSVQEGASGGSISSTGVYQAPPNAVGTFHVVAVSHADPSQVATATVVVQAGSASVTVQ